MLVNIHTSILVSYLVVYSNTSFLFLSRLDVDIDIDIDIIPNLSIYILPKPHLFFIYLISCRDQVFG